MPQSRTLDILKVFGAAERLGLSKELAKQIDLRLADVNASEQPASCQGCWEQQEAAIRRAVRAELSRIEVNQERIELIIRRDHKKMTKYIALNSLTFLSLIAAMLFFQHS